MKKIVKFVTQFLIFFLGFSKGDGGDGPFDVGGGGVIFG